jgi:hypothetical protein
VSVDPSKPKRSTSLPAGTAACPLSPTLPDRGPNCFVHPSTGIHECLPHTQQGDQSALVQGSHSHAWVLKGTQVPRINSKKPCLRHTGEKLGPTGCGGVASPSICLSALICKGRGGPGSRTHCLCPLGERAAAACLSPRGEGRVAETGPTGNKRDPSWGTARSVFKAHCKGHQDQWGGEGRPALAH